MPKDGKPVNHKMARAGVELIADPTKSVGQALVAAGYAVSTSRNPKANAYYRCVEDHFEQLDAVWLPARRAYASERKSSPWNLSAVGGSSEPPFPKSA